jgi:hypothetical protein
MAQIHINDGLFAYLATAVLIVYAALVCVEYVNAYGILLPCIMPTTISCIVSFVLVCCV